MREGAVSTQPDRDLTLAAAVELLDRDDSLMIAPVVPDYSWRRLIPINDLRRLIERESADAMRLANAKDAMR